MKALNGAPKINGPEPVSPGRVNLKEEARKARSRLLPTTLTFLGLSAAALVAGVHAGPVRWAVAFAALGVVAFTFVEYAVHRFVLHRRFLDGPGWRHILHQAFDHLHVQHHARPWDSNHNGGTLNDTLVPLIAIFALAFLTTPLATGPVFWAAIAASYVAEEWIHHAIHYCSFTHPAFLALRRYHFVHHAAPGTEANYGLSSPLWDAVLGTSFKSATAARPEGGSVNFSKSCAALVASLLVVAPSPAKDMETRCLTTAPGECLQVTISGEGRDVVLIPGLFGSAFGFRRIIPLLNAAGYRSIVVEPLGVGHSARPPLADYSLTAQGDRIQEALDKLGVKNAVLVSHSIGTSMALRLAYRHPDQIRAVVSIEGGPAEEVSTPGFRRAMKLAPLLKLFGAGRIVRGRVRGMLVERSGNPDWVSEEIVNSYAEGATKDVGATLDAFSQMAKAREPEALAPRLPEVKCPVRLVLGSAPHTGGPSDAEIQVLVQGLAFFSITRVPGAGNFIFEEAPDAVLAAVNEVEGAARLTRRAEK